ncbi:MAG: hypothetical protein JXR60_10700 [Bacteroidales bacterium]|nr:hypothetical protein [Bacteroidales bacterium]
MKKPIYFIALIISLTLTLGGFSQVDKTLELCDLHIVPPFVSDGQEYRALLKTDEIAEFNVTFYGGSTYRIVACSGAQEGNLIFSIYDREKNLLFTNRDYQFSPYWDFKIKNTVNLIIEAELKQKEGNSGFAFLQIGFKQ